MRKLTVGIGERFNKLTVIQMIERTSSGFSVADCRCDCGNTLPVKVAELRSGHKKSCGCSTWKAKSAASSADIVGNKFSRLFVRKLLGSDNRKYRLCECLCDCGQTVKIRIAQMLSGEIQSCGCLQKEKAMENLAKAQRSQITHGMSGTLLYLSWTAMMQRCFNPWCELFHRYGAVGITPCTFLKSSPINLLLLIGNRESALMSLDRIDNEGGYWCGSCEECLTQEHKLNVRWATAKQQALNRSNNRMVEIDGVVKAASEWCELMGLPKGSKQIYTYPK